MIETQPFYINIEFDNFDEFAQLSKQLQWDLEFRKLNTGTFKSHTQMIGFDKVQLGKTKLTSTLLQNGLSPRGFRTFVLAANDSQALLWMKQKVSTKDLVVYRADNFWESVSHDGFDMFTIDIEQEYLRTLMDESELLKCKENLCLEEKIIRLDDATLVKIRSFLNQLFYKLEQNTLNIHSPNVHHKILYKLPRLLLQILNESTDEIPSKKRRKRDIAVDKAVSYIKSTNYNKITIPDLCNYADVSERTLEYGFHENYSVSPIQFIKANKLNNVRQEILHAKNGCTISELAQKHGFQHMGQFAADYKNFFGELPSETLR